MNPQQDHEVCDALMSQIEDARYLVMMEGRKPSEKVESLVSREAFEAFKRVNPWFYHDSVMSANTMCATRVHIIDRPGIWFLTVICE